MLVRESGLRQRPVDAPGGRQRRRRPARPTRRRSRRSRCRRAPEVRRRGRFPSRRRKPHGVVAEEVRRGHLQRGRFRHRHRVHRSDGGDSSLVPARRRRRDRAPKVRRARLLRRRGRRSVLVLDLLVLLGQVVLDDDPGGRLRRDLRDVDLGVRLLLLRHLVARGVPPPALPGRDGHSCSPEHLEVRPVRDQRLAGRRNRLAFDPDQVQRVVELRMMKLFPEEVALVVGGRRFLEGELPVCGRRPVVVLPVVHIVFEKDLMEISQRDALRPLQVSQARRVSLRHVDDASCAVLLHDAIHCFSNLPLLS